jgi:hypothetical protein
VRSAVDKHLLYIVHTALTIHLRPNESEVVRLYVDETARKDGDVYEQLVAINDSIIPSPNPTFHRTFQYPISSIVQIPVPAYM